MDKSEREKAKTPTNEDEQIIRTTSEKVKFIICINYKMKKVTDTHSVNVLCLLRFRQVAYVFPLNRGRRHSAAVIYML